MGCARNISVSGLDFLFWQNIFLEQKVMIILRPDIPAWGMKDKPASGRLAAPDKRVSGRLAPDRLVSGTLPAPGKPVWADIQQPGPRKRVEQSRSTVRVTIWIFELNNIWWCFVLLPSCWSWYCTWYFSWVTDECWVMCLALYTDSLPRLSGLHRCKRGGRDK